MRTLLLEARGLGRRLRLERGRARGPGQHLQLRPRHVPHDPGDRGAGSRRSRPALPRRRPGRRSTCRGPARRRGSSTTTSSAPSTGSAATIADQIDGYRRYMQGGRSGGEPGARRRRATPPSVTGLIRTALREGAGGAITLLRWSRMSAADVHAPVLQPTSDSSPRPSPSGPFVWGMSPEAPGTGLGALNLAMHHVAGDRPPGGWQRHAADRAARASFAAGGGVVRTAPGDDDPLRRRPRPWRHPRRRRASSTRRSSCRRAIRTARSSSGCRTRRPEPQAMVARWRDQHHHEGYESKIDAVLDAAPALPAARRIRRDADLALVPDRGHRPVPRPRCTRRPVS